MHLRVPQGQDSMKPLSILTAAIISHPFKTDGVSNYYESGYIKSLSIGVPIVVQWLTNPTRNYEVAGSIPALAQWVNDMALL